MLQRCPCRWWKPKVWQVACAVFVAAFLIALPTGSQQASTASTTDLASSLEVASIKPSQPDDRGRKLRTSADRITVENFSLKELIVYAWNLQDNSQVLGGPDWIDKAHFDIAGVVSEPEMTKLRALPTEDKRKEWSVILQSLLAERFQLKVSLRMRTMPVYTLVVAKSGSKLKPASASAN